MNNITKSKEKKEFLKKQIKTAVFVDYEVSDNCKNLEESYGEICVKCGKCGRKFKNGMLIK